MEIVTSRVSTLESACDARATLERVSSISWRQIYEPTLDHSGIGVDCNVQVSLHHSGL